MKYKNKTVLIILSYLLGFLGVDRMYLGCTKSGIAKMLTFGGFGVWYIIDLVFILINGYNKSNKPAICDNYKWEKQSIKNGYYATLIVLALYALKFVFGFYLAFFNIPFTLMSNMKIFKNISV